MKPIELNLASNPYRNDAPLTAGLALLLVTALVFSAFNAFAYLTADDTKTRLESQLANHKSTMNAMRTESDQIREELAAVDAEVLGAQASFVSGILAQRNFSWTALLNSLEDVLPWNVRLSIIRPEFGNMGRVTLALRGTARDVDAFYNFQDALEGSQDFSEVVPGNWQYANRDSMRDDTVEFVLTCRYEQSESGGGDEAEAQKASISLGDAGEGERIVVDGEDDEAGGSDVPLLDPEPQVLRDESLAQAAPEQPAAANERPSRREAPRAGGADVRQSPETRAERRARRARARAGGEMSGVAGGVAGGTQAAGSATEGSTEQLRSRGGGSRTTPGVLGGSAGQGSQAQSRGSGRNQQPAATEGAETLPGQQPPKQIPVEELVEVGEDGVKNLKLKPAPERPASTGEEGSEQGEEGSASKEGSSSGEQGSTSSGSSGSSSGGSSSGGQS